MTGGFFVAADQTWRAHRGRLNALRRHRSPDDPAIADAARDLKATRLADHIRAVVDAAPPLTEEQRARLAALLAPPAMPDAARSAPEAA
jgi:hypothetical protein